MGLHRVGHDWSNLACMYALEREMATHSSVLAWTILGTAEPGGLSSTGSHRVGHNWSDLAVAAAVAQERDFLLEQRLWIPVNLDAVPTDSPTPLATPSQFPFLFLNILELPRGISIMYRLDSYPLLHSFYAGIIFILWVLNPSSAHIDYWKRTRSIPFFIQWRFLILPQ